MEYRTLGRTGLSVSLLGMGTGGFHCLGQRSDPPLPESEMRRLLHQVFDRGINLFDTAPGYLDSELILGRALRELPRDQVVVSTKVVLSSDWEDGSIVLSSPQQVAASIEASLQRLQLSEIDLILVGVAVSACAETVVAEQLPVLQKFQRQGKIRFIGSSEYSGGDGSHQWLQKALPTDAFDVVMVAYNMLNQSARTAVFPQCLARNIGVMNIFTVRNLFGGPRRLPDVVGDLKKRGLLPAEIDEKAPLDWLLADPNVDSLIEAAYRFAAYTPGVSTVMCGSIILENIDQDIQSLEKGPLDPAHIDRLAREFGHLDEAIGD